MGTIISRIRIILSHKHKLISEVYFVLVWALFFVILVEISVSEVTIEHILSSIAKYTSKRKTAKILLCGDFNDLNTSEITNLHPLEQIVNFPTRENNTLDLILTDIEEYKSAGCVKEAPILTNDHCAIAIPSANCIPNPKYHTIKKKIITQSVKIALTQELSSIMWNEMYKLESADAKVRYLHATVNKIYEKHCPIKNVRAPVNKPYISSPLIRKLQRAKRTAYNNHNLCWKFLSKQNSFVAEKRST